eukprot:7406037-Alexandrium_andersonii.AAC.1
MLSEHQAPPFGLSQPRHVPRPSSLHPTLHPPDPHATATQRAMRTRRLFKRKAGQAIPLYLSQ